MREYLSVLVSEDDFKDWKDKSQAEDEEISLEYSFMNNIESWPALKVHILESKFWAESWSISQLQKDLNIKLLIYRMGMRED